MVLVELRGPEEIIGFNPHVYDAVQDFSEGDHTVPVEFHLVVPAGKTYRVHLHIDITGVLP